MDNLSISRTQTTLESNFHENAVPVSVIIPCFNNADYLAQCVDSINSMVQPKEIIIVDDKSTDHSLEVAKLLSEKYYNVRIFYRSQNGGAAAARYDGILNAKCDWISFVDADDRVAENAVAIAYSKACDELSDICIWDMWRFDSLRTWCNIPIDRASFPKTGRQSVLETFGSWQIHPLGVSKKKLYLTAYDGFTETMLNADELISRLVFSAAKQVSFCESKYFYRVNLQSSTQKISIRRLSTLNSYLWLLKFVKSYPEVKPEAIGTGAIAQAWGYFRSRERYGALAVNDAFSKFLPEFIKIGELKKWLWRYPKYFIAFSIMYIFFYSKLT